MIPFDATKISIEIIRLKSITQALGGSIQVIDEEKTVGKNEFYKRVIIPLAVARAFIVRHKKITKYLKPVYTAVIRYDGMVISLERHPLGAMGELVTEGLNGEPKTWIPYAQTNLDDLIFPFVNKGTTDWYFDGRYIFSFDQNDMNVVLNNSESMTDDNHFRKVVTTAIDFQELCNADKLQPHSRDCLAFVAENGEYAVSAPIWKDIHCIGVSRSRESDDDDFGIDDDSEDRVTTSLTSFSKLNETMSVNLNFALRAGKEIGTMFGYEDIEPLQLSRLMIELHTINLPNIPKQIKATYDVGLSFTHSLAWLLGLIKKANTLETYIMVRSLLKYLTKRGIYRNDKFDAKQIFKDDSTVDSVKLKSLDVLLGQEDFTRHSLASILGQTAALAQQRKLNKILLGHE